MNVEYSSKCRAECCTATFAKTNAESNQANAIKALEQGKLNDWEKGFVQTIRNLNKKGLQKLTSKQYDTLRSIADKAE